MAAAGTVVIAVGSFLPWLQSGHARRSSYATGGAIRALVDAQGGRRGFDALLTAWPALPLLCATAAALWLLVLFARPASRPIDAAAPRLILAAAAVVTVVAAALAATGAVIALRHHSSAVARIVTAGPALTLAGSVLALAAAVTAAALVPLTRRRWRAR